ncbi:hypothetical protein EKO27_g8502 [Xylaria grammica]|uniref:F-box domain-containing protein n=1 Tax=Xylaria grammica TaxID=363999 RepID=A0A439CWL0_9PEZI|nr:hypothetical protein EKO27_g8502 [Xylaria grammica]
MAIRASLPQQCYQLSTEFHFRFTREFRCRLYPKSPVDCPHIYDEDSGSWEDDDTDDDDDEYRDLPYFDRIAQRARLVLSRFADDQLRSLRFYTPPYINRHQLLTPWGDGGGTEIDLSSFHQLRSLGWKAPSAKNLEALSVALRSNSIHLQEFDLDFVDLDVSRASVGEDGDDDYEGGSYDLGAILGMDERSPRPYFPELRVLSLTQVPITPSMMAIADFSTLASLTLRRCPGSAELLGHIAEQTITINLQRLEFQSWDYSPLESICIRELIPGFAGLEELFILENGPQDTVGLWDNIATNHATLRKFVYHQITSDLDDEGSNYFKEFRDVQDLGILLFNRDMMDQAEALRGLRSCFRQFLEWVFGLNGLPSLQVVVFGDFAMSDVRYTVIACRDTNESTSFQIISPSHPKMRTILSEYRDVLRACPSDLSIRTWHA